MEIFGMVAFIVVAVIVYITYQHVHTPKETMFTCGRCREKFDHTRRTIAAWRQGKRRFYCDACHRKWLATHAVSRKATGSGCLLLLALIVFSPLAFVLVF